MHELALMNAVVERVCATARAEHARRVTDIRLVCGEMSGVVPDALNFCFDICVAGTIAEGATLHVERMPAAWRCASCTTDAATLPDDSGTCPRCGTASLQLVQGREFSLASITVED